VTLVYIGITTTAISSSRFAAGVIELLVAVLLKPIVMKLDVSNALLVATPENSSPQMFTYDELANVAVIVVAPPPVGAAHAQVNAWALG